MVERDNAACAFISDNISRLGATQIDVRQGDVSDILARKAGESYDVVFIDPPFRQGLIPLSIRQLESGSWLNDDAKIYVEMEKQSTPGDIPEHWHLLRGQQTGNVRYCLYERIVNQKQ